MLTFPRAALATLALATMAAGTAPAATLAIDLTDNTFVPGSVVYSASGPIVQFGESAGGVTFTFATTGQFREVGPWTKGTTAASPPWALTWSGGGNPSTFTLSVDSDVELTGFLGFDRLNLTGVVFDVTGTGVDSVGNSFSTAGNITGTTPSTPILETFVGGPLSLLAGEVYSFTATNGGAATQSYLTGLEFRISDTGTPTTPIPLPAGAWLLLTALAGVAAVRRRSASA